MATLKGTWRFNDNVIASEDLITQSVAFETPAAIVFDYDNKTITSTDGSTSWICMSSGNNLLCFYDVIYESANYGGLAIRLNETWDIAEVEMVGDIASDATFAESLKTITFTSEQEVSDEFYEWFTANATRIDEEETPLATITYGGAELTTLNANETVSLHTTEKRMEDDIEVTITAKDYDGSVEIEGEAAPATSIPVEIETEAEMTALLETAELGSVYKYAGESGTYENGTLYIVEAVAE